MERIIHFSSQFGATIQSDRDVGKAGAGGSWPYCISECLYSFHRMLPPTLFMWVFSPKIFSQLNKADLQGDNANNLKG